MQTTVFLALLVSSFSSTALTTLTATIDKNPVMANESLILTIEADDQVSADALDTRALLKDFVVGNTSTSSQTQIINGSINHQTKWTTLLVSKTPGNYIIPAFTIDKVSSQPMRVRVIPASKPSATDKKDVFIETTVENDSVYLQGTIQLITKLYLAVDIQRGSLTEPKMDNANIQQLGKDEELSDIKNGTRYRVIKRVYLITPQRSGDYVIKSPVFSGELVMSKRRSFFSGFNNTKPVSLMGEDIAITVKPIPQDYEGQWLPSDLVAIHEEWQPNDQTFTVGDPITRTITLTAIGVSEEQLPEITVQYPADLKTYPDQSDLNSVTRDDRLISQRKDSIAIVPGKAGKLTLPEVKIPWWNTRTNRKEFATLPAKTIDVQPSTSSNTPLTPIAAPVVAPQLSNVPAQTVIKEIAVNSILTWSFLAAWLVTLLLWLIHVRYLTKNKPGKQQITAPIGASGKTSWNQFATACKNNEAIAANSALLQWGRTRWPAQSFTSTLEIALFLDHDKLISAVKELQQHLYGNNQKTWQGQTLLGQLKATSEPKKTASKTQLNPLHP